MRCIITRWSLLNVVKENRFRVYIRVYLNWFLGGLLLSSIEFSGVLYAETLSCFTLFFIVKFENSVISGLKFNTHYYKIVQSWVLSFTK